MANTGAGSKVDAVVKLALISFVVILSFAVGTFVGKQVSDADHRRAELENDYPVDSQRSVASTTEEAAVPESESITDEEIAALRKEFEQTEVKSAPKTTADKHAEKDMDHAPETVSVTKDGYKKVGASHETKPATKTAPAKHEEAKAEHKPEPVAKAAERVALALAPTKDVKAPRVPNTALPSVATSAIGKYTVQVASFASENEAREQVGKLKEKGFGAFYVAADVKGQTWYRVSVGLFADQNSAMDYRKEILDSKSVSSAIVQKIVK